MANKRKAEEQDGWRVWSEEEFEEHMKNPYFCYAAATRMIEDGSWEEAKQWVEKMEDYWQYSNINGGCAGVLWLCALQLDPDNTERHVELQFRARALGYHNAIASHEVHKLGLQFPARKRR